MSAKQQRALLQEWTVKLPARPFLMRKCQNLLICQALASFGECRWTPAANSHQLHLVRLPQEVGGPLDEICFGSSQVLAIDSQALWPGGGGTTPGFCCLCGGGLLGKGLLPGPYLHLATPFAVCAGDGKKKYRLDESMDLSLTAQALAIAVGLRNLAVTFCR